MEDEELDHYKFMIKWVDGKPVPAHTKMINKEAVSQLPLTVFSLPYKRTKLEKEKGIAQEFEGMSNAEVAMIRLADAAAHGDQKALDMLQDRIVGKPMVSTENKNINLTYEDLLDSIARKEEKEK